MLCLLTYVIFKLINKEEGVFTTIPFPTSTTSTDTTIAKDTYTPNYADEQENLSDFEPDPKKPLKVVLKDEQGNSKEFITSEGEQMNPIETDDVFEEEEENGK